MKGFDQSDACELPLLNQAKQVARNLTRAGGVCELPLLNQAKQEPVKINWYEWTALFAGIMFAA